MKSRTASESALLIALLLKRAGKKRAQIGSATIRKLSGRPELRAAFMEDLRRALDDLGFSLIEVDHGGYVVLAWSALRGTATVTAKKFLPEFIGGENLDVAALMRELDGDEREEEGDEDAQEG